MTLKSSDSKSIGCILLNLSEYIVDNYIFLMSVLYFKQNNLI